jgi:hypothetical protein
MSDEGRDQMRARLNEFSQRLDARAREFEQQGELSDLHRSLLGQIDGRRQRLPAKLVAAEASVRHGRSSKPNSSETSARLNTICC